MKKVFRRNYENEYDFIERWGCIFFPALLGTAILLFIIFNK